MASALNELPYEVLDKIMKELSSKDDLRNARLVSSRMSHLANHIMFKSLELDPYEDTGNALCRVAASDRLRVCVRELSITSCRCGCADEVVHQKSSIDARV